MLDMNCETIKARIESYVDGDLAPSVSEAIEHHLRGCTSCSTAHAAEQQLRDALRRLPVAGPTPGFFDRALKEAAARNRRHHHWLGVGFGGGLAAGLALWMVTGWFTPNPSPADRHLAAVTISVNQVRTVNVAINARHELNQARLTITLPDGVELAGFPGRRQLSWHTDLKAGNNLLQLPVIAHSTKGGILVARVQHHDQTETLEINMAADDGRQAYIAPQLKARA